MEGDKPVPRFGRGPDPGIAVSCGGYHVTTVTGRSRAAGRYQIVGAIPGDYLLFAVPRSEDHEYFALDFADRNQDKAEHVTIAAHAAQVVNLKGHEVSIAF